MVFVGIASLIVAMGVAWLATPAAIRLARWLGAVDLPAARKIHDEPIPRIGGIAVFVGFIAGLAFAAHVTGNLWTVSTVSVYWRGLAVAAMARKCPRDSKPPSGGPTSRRYASWTRAVG